MKSETCVAKCRISHPSRKWSISGLRLPCGEREGRRLPGRNRKRPMMNRLEPSEIEISFWFYFTALYLFMARKGDFDAALFFLENSTSCPCASEWNIFDWKINRPLVGIYIVLNFIHTLKSMVWSLSLIFLYLLREPFGIHSRLLTFDI